MALSQGWTAPPINQGNQGRNHGVLKNCEAGLKQHEAGNRGHVVFRCHGKHQKGPGKGSEDQTEFKGADQPLVLCGAKKSGNFLTRKKQLPPTS